MILPLHRARADVFPDFHSQFIKPKIRQRGELDNDIEMDGGPVKDGDMDPRGQPTMV
jgi:hypothetical protein